MPRKAYMPREITMDIFWRKKHLPVKYCLICSRYIGHRKLLCTECVKELKGVETLNVKG